jgi:hypothetical protein
MPTAYKILGQSAPADTNNANLYTVPSLTSTVVSSIVVANTGTQAATSRIFARIGGAAAATTNAIVYDVSIPPQSSTTFTLGITLAATDILTVRSNTANTLTFSAFGSEIS